MTLLSYPSNNYNFYYLLPILIIHIKMKMVNKYFILSNITFLKYITSVKEILKYQSFINNSCFNQINHIRMNYSYLFKIYYWIYKFVYVALVCIQFIY